MLSTWLGTGVGTSSYLCISCMHLGYGSCSHLSPELKHTTQKWFCLLHILPNARHCLCICAALEHLQFSIFNSLFCSLGCYSSAVFVCLHFCTCLKFFMLFILSSTFSSLSVLPLFQPTLIPVHCLFLVYFWMGDVSSFMISCMTSASSIPFINYSSIIFFVISVCYFYKVYPSTPLWIHFDFCVI